MMICLFEMCIVIMKPCSDCIWMLFRPVKSSNNNNFIYITLLNNKVTKQQGIAAELY